MTGEELRATLRELGMRQKELAARLGFTDSAMSRFVRARPHHESGKPAEVPRCVEAYLALAKKCAEAKIPLAD